MSVAEIPHWRWTIEAYDTATAAGLFDGQRVELINGEVFQLAPMLPRHAATVNIVHSWFVRHLDTERWAIGAQTPVRLTDDEPEPDLWLARGSLRQYRRRHPTASDLTLVIEIAESSLAFDRDIKLPRYAKAGVANVWIVALGTSSVHAFAEPTGTSYRFTREVMAGDTLLVPETETTIEVATLLGDA